MKKTLLIFICMAIAGVASAQKIALKSNLFWDASLTPNLALEFGLGPKTTIEAYGAYNPFEFNDNKQWKHWIVQPEFRLWTCERFNGTFFGLHAHGGEFSVSGFEAPFGILSDLKDHRYEGYFYGAGISVGYQWILSDRWSFETSVGAGYARIHYEKYPCVECGTLIEKGTYNYWGVTRAQISFMYFFR